LLKEQQELEVNIMDDATLFGPTIDLATRALNLRARKHKVILSNIANADTPGYKAFDLMIEKAIAGQKTKSDGSLRLDRTNAVHLDHGDSTSVEVKPRKLETPQQITLRGDGNTVDMDREMTVLAANQLLFKASSQIISNKFKGLKSVIQGGS
jgi:flagellar basal-body rod protein FlgB